MPASGTRADARAAGSRGPRASAEGRGPALRGGAHAARVGTSHLGTRRTRGCGTWGCRTWGRAARGGCGSCPAPVTAALFRPQTTARGSPVRGRWCSGSSPPSTCCTSWPLGSGRRRRSRRAGQRPPCERPRPPPADTGRTRDGHGTEARAPFRRPAPGLCCVAAGSQEGRAVPRPGPAGTLRFLSLTLRDLNASAVY